MLELAKIEQRTFPTLGELRDYVEDEDMLTNIHKVNMNFASFEMKDDKKFVFTQYNPNTLSKEYEFTEDAVKKLFSIIGCYNLFPAMMLKSSFGMATAYINNVLARTNPYIKKLNGYNFIEKDNVILGFFSNKYVYIKNKDILNETTRLCGLDDTNSNFDFTESSLVNTRMNLRVINKLKGFKINDYSKETDDFCNLGFELRNSHIADTSLHTKLYYERLICANKMISRNNQIHSTVVHRGDAKSKIQDLIANTQKGYEELKHRIDTLLDIRFDLRDHARLGTDETCTAYKLIDTDAPFKVLPELNKVKWFNPKKKSKDASNERVKLNANINTLENMHNRYPGICSNIFNSKYKADNEKSMFDWTEIFTERANNSNYSITEREQIQENVGNLVEFIAKKKAHFHSVRDLNTNQ